MADFEISDNVGNSVDGVPNQVNSVGSLKKYLVAEPLHLLVIPDLAKVSKDKLSEATQGRPIQFQLDVQHGFDFGSSSRKIAFTPESKVTLGIDTGFGHDLFSDGSFAEPCTIPDKTGYVSLSLCGSLEVDGSAPAATDLTLGFKTHSSVTLQYYRGFPLGNGEPAVGAALGETAGHFVVPASVPDLLLLHVNDVATVSGTGSITVCGDFKFSLVTNPLASIDLPLGAGTIAVKDGVVEDLRASFQLEAAYQTRAHKLDQNTVELLFVPEKSTTFQFDTSLSAGVSAEISGTELIAELLGAIDAASTPGAAVLVKAGLTPEETETLCKGVKAGIDRSLAASVKDSLKALVSNESAFIYRIQLDRLTPDSTAAIEAALHADLSPLNRLEANKQSDGTIAPGVRVLKSVLSKLHDSSCTINLNLLGILNFTSLAEFIKKSEVVTDSVTGDVTLKETLTGNRISGILEPFKRDEALRKALFDSVVATLVHSASGKTNLDFSISGLHFAFNQNTNQQNLRDYLGWFSAFGLLLPSEHDAELQLLPAKGLSTCLLRVNFEPSRTSSLFLTTDGTPHSEADYIEIGRRALIALLDPDNKRVDGYRKAVLEDAVLLANVMQAGGISDLHSLLLPPANVDPFITDIYFDGKVIAWWSSSMANVARSLQTFKTSGSKFDDLSKAVSKMVSHSPARFDQPWGLLSLCLLAASDRFGKIVTGNLTFERSAALPLRATAV